MDHALESNDTWSKSDVFPKQCGSKKVFPINILVKEMVIFIVIFQFVMKDRTHPIFKK